ncbi:MAG: sulfite exporter TauE/SafE family protein [Veillonellales bacterium]
MLQNGKMIGFGFIAGILSGLLGVGGGIVLVPIMVACLGLTQHIAHATSLAVIVPTAFAGSIIYGLHGNSDLILALTLAVGSVFGASLGARWMPRIPAAQLKRLFGMLLLIVGVRMVLS